MKKIMTLLLTAGSIAFAQTNITTPTVSGTWTLAGSPYIVQNIITVPAAQVLTIEPGVVIKFLSQTKLKIDGQLIANGTSAAPIIFEASDTTGWSNQSTPNGGWNGVHFHPYTGGGIDNSVFNYCTVKDAKYGYAYLVTYANAFTCERGLKISHSTFTHNHTGTGYYCASAPVYLIPMGADTVELEECTITDNTAVIGVVLSGVYYGGYNKISGCNIHNNHIGSGIYAIQNNHTLIENNEIHHNSLSNGNPALYVSVGEAYIRGNKIHHNECYDVAAVNCNSGKITIENNLISNNRQTNAFCGLTGGGGGLRIGFNDFGSTFNDTYYIVRNNIIANNYSAYGGGGIMLNQARATITNNHIINNIVPVTALGKSMLIGGVDTEVHIKNNLFYSVSPAGITDTVQTVYIASAETVLFDYNYIPSRYSQAVRSSAYVYTLAGDTIHNVIGTAPGMIAPTIDNNYLTNALTANFNLSFFSPCVNKGDSVNAFSSTVDYAGNNRMNGIIDIGAYEYGTSQEPTAVENIEDKNSLKIYPNPTDMNTGFTVVTPSEEGRLLIYETSGKLIYNQLVYGGHQMVNTMHLSTGIYFVHFYGKVNAVEKILIR